MKTIDDERDIATDHRPRRRPRSIDLRPRPRRSVFVHSGQVCVALFTFAAVYICGHLFFFLMDLYRVSGSR